MTYKYITENNLFNRQTYMYSEYGGISFLQEYLHSRYEYLENQNGAESSVLEAIEMDSGSSLVKSDLLKLKGRLKNSKWDKEVKGLINAYTKSFEVRKRIYEEYDNNWKPISGAGFEDYEIYLLFAECLLLFCQNSKKNLKYFSCLLKLDDTILSIQDKLAEKLKKRFYDILMQELNIFHVLATENGICLEEYNDN